MADYDVIVVGGGPAGAMAAWRLALNGAKTLLVERQSLPRHKTCGGGVPMSAANLLEMQKITDLAPDSFVELTVKHLMCTFNFANEYLLPVNAEGRDEAGIWMVQRSSFDHALVKRAAAAGAEVRDATRLMALDAEDHDHPQITLSYNGDHETHSARFIIGADGANGVVARLAGIRTTRSVAIAAEAEVPIDWNSVSSKVRKDVIHLEFGDVPGGYSWLFPKGNHINAGAGLFSELAPNHTSPHLTKVLLQNCIMKYLDHAGIPYERDSLRYHFHPLPLWNGKHSLQNRRGSVLLAGDAAGLVNPIFGDGILHALRSGDIAARCIVGGTATNYTREINTLYQSNFDSAQRMARLFYRWPEISYNLLVPRPGAGQIAMRLLSGEAPFTGMTRRMLRRISSSVASTRKGKYDRANH